MRRPRQIPPSVPFEELAARPEKRLLYIGGFEHFSWYPNCCVEVKADLTEADALRKEMNRADPDPGSRITFNHLINKAVANALPHHLLFNAKRTWRDTVMVYRPIHVANVVDVDGMASQVVIRDADRLSLRELAQQSHRMISARRIDQAKRVDRFDQLRRAVRLVDVVATALPYVGRILRDYSNRVAMDLLEARPGTTLVTNPGTLGVADCKAMFFFGFRMTCLRVMGIEEEPVMRDGQVTFRKVLPMGLDYDQRLCDAGPATRLLNEIRRNLEHAREYCVGPAPTGEER